tara:strand:+ start:302 stop:739 length:438 start_codon:yes stop_codon:yes gene_type:complete
MIKKFIIFILSINVYAEKEDSLFWFDANTLDNQLPKFPLIINKVFSEENITLSGSKKKIDRAIKEVFRIQIFESSVASIARAEAKRFQNILGDTVYTDFETPLYKLRIGNFKNRKNAEKAIESISRLGAKDAWIIRTKANLREKL